MKTKKPLLYLRRKFDAFLSDWKMREDRLPLIIKGARQVGKTESVRHFAEVAYKNYVEINFVERPEFKEIIRDGYSVDALIRNLSIVYCIRSHTYHSRVEGQRRNSRYG